MSYGVRKIAGIGPVVAKKLATADIRTTDALLVACSNRRERRLLAERSGLPEGQLQRFVNMADLMRIRGIGADFAELLSASGVRTVRDLSRRSALNLAAKMSTVNAARKLSRRAPSASMVERWITQARKLKDE